MLKKMTSMERVLTALSFKEPDKVPLFLLLSIYGAKEMGVKVEKYFANSDNVINMQLAMQKKYHNDCFYAFYYAGIEIEASGGEIVFFGDNGPPNTGAPILKDMEDIKKYNPPKVRDAKCLLKVLRTIEGLKVYAKDEIPIIGVVMSPFSLPVMQLGFDKYLDLIFNNRELFDCLMKINESFCVEWANAQLEAGATAICYFDPVSSPTIIPRDVYLTTGFQVARRTIAQIKGPTATHLASGRVLNIIEDLKLTGTKIISTGSHEEDIKDIKNKCQDYLAVIGNLNGIEMCRWNVSETEIKINKLLEKAAPGGGFILSDFHGEIPYHVDEKILLKIAETVNNWSRKQEILF